MKQNTQSKIAFILVAVSIALTIIVEAFSEKLRKIEWIDVDVLILLVIAGIFLGTLLGWLSFKFRLGKIAAIVGTITLLWVFFVFFSKKSGAEQGGARQPTPALDSRSEGNENPGPESDGSSQ